MLEWTCGSLLVQPCWLSSVTYSRLPRTVSRQGLKNLTPQHLWETCSNAVTKDDKNSKVWKYCCLWVMPDFCTRKKKPSSWMRHAQRIWAAVVSYKSHMFSMYSTLAKAIWVNMETALQMLKCGITIQRHNMLLRLYKYRTLLIILSWGTGYDLSMPFAIQTCII